jgi:hypothetical protein
MNLALHVRNLVCILSSKAEFLLGKKIDMLLEIWGHLTRSIEQAFSYIPFYLHNSTYTPLESNIKEALQNILENKTIFQVVLAVR